jgi:hypothetical protein
MERHRLHLYHGGDPYHAHGVPCDGAEASCELHSHSHRSPWDRWGRSQRRGMNNGSKQCAFENLKIHKMDKTSLLGVVGSCWVEKVLGSRLLYRGLGSTMERLRLLFHLVLVRSCKDFPQPGNNQYKNSRIGIKSAGNCTSILLHVRKRQQILHL